MNASPTICSPGEAVAIVLRARDQARRLPVVVGIDGPSGSGKTSFALALHAQAPEAHVVHLDDLYAGWDGLAGAPASLAAQLLTPLRRQLPAGYRRFDWEKGRFAEHVPVPQAATIIIDGCGSTAAAARDLTDVRVWLEAAAPTRLKRALGRDGDTFASHWQRWAAQERALFTTDDTRAHAHYRFDTQEWEHQPAGEAAATCSMPSGRPG